MIALLISGLGAGGVRADTPGESFLVEAKDIHPRVLQDAIGVLSLTVSRGYCPGAEVTHLRRHRVRAGAFVRDGTLALEDVAVISSVPWDSFRVLRFPIVGVQGPYREIVYQPVQDLRTWIDIAAVARRCAACRGGEQDRVEELYFTEEHLSGRVTLFARDATRPRRLYSTPEEGSTFDLLMPPAGAPRRGGGQDSQTERLSISRVREGFAEVQAESGEGQPAKRLGWIDFEGELPTLGQRKPRKLYPGPERSRFTLSPPAAIVVRQGDARAACDELFFNRIEKGFAELWTESAAGLPPKRLGFVKLADGGCEGYRDYFADGSGGFLADIFFLTGTAAPRRLYQAPDPGASYRLILPGESPFGSRMYVVRFGNGFALLAEFDYCFSEALRPIGWIEIRDAERRLTLWPVHPDSCD